MLNEPAFPVEPAPVKKLAWQPALVFGTLATLAAAVLVAANQAVADGKNVPLGIAAALLPLVAAFLTKQRVVSSEWIRDVVAVSDTLTAALRPIAEQAGAPASDVPRA
jgi:hypothetical protein